jgi:uncharacterized protein (TIRG00374 family)
MGNPRVWLGLLVSAACIVFLARSVDLAELGAALAGANPFWMLATLLILVFSMYLKAYRWRLFFPEPGRVSMHGLLSSLYIGYMINTVLPLRAGEIVRAFLVGESERVSKSTALATVLVEKVLDLGTVALFLFVLRFFIVLPDWADAAAVLGGIGIVVAIVGLAIVLLARGPTLRLIGGLEARVPILRRLAIGDLVASFLDGLAFVRDPRTLALVTLWSVVMWFGSGLGLYFGLLAANIGVGLAVGLLVMAVTNLGMAVPSAPGYVGVFHSAVVLSLTPFGVDPSQALASAIIMHTLVFGFFVLGGLFYLVRYRRGSGAGKGLGGLVARAQSAANEAPSH